MGLLVNVVEDFLLPEWMDGFHSARCGLVLARSSHLLCWSVGSMLYGDVWQGRLELLELTVLCVHTAHSHVGQQYYAETTAGSDSCDNFRVLGKCVFTLLLP